MSVDFVHPETSNPIFRYGPWKWREPLHREHFRSCSFCGSIHPVDLAEELTWRADWADRKYGWPHKFYVDIPNREPDALFAIGSTSAKDGPGSFDGNLDWIAIGDMTPEQRSIVERDRFFSENTTYIGFGKRAVHHAKFYTIHLADTTIDAAVKDVIQRKSGLRFEFVEGHVKWSGWDYQQA